ncbi:MAG: hypothetical protein WBG40_00205, partial [Candidatus Sulfotelmatobacter sp.]
IHMTETGGTGLVRIAGRRFGRNFWVGMFRETFFNGQRKALHDKRDVLANTLSRASSNRVAQDF